MRASNVENITLKLKNVKPLVKHFTKTRDQIRIFTDVQLIQTVIVS